MGIACCKEFRGWWRSFTRTEAALAALQAALLITFIAFLTFLILHLLACASAGDGDIKTPIQSIETSTNYISTLQPLISSEGTTLDPEIECTWKPSEKTTAAVRYYENGQTSSKAVSESPKRNLIGQVKDTSLSNELQDKADSRVADDIKKGFLLALVRLKLRNDVTFGCVLTIISEYSTLTAASCIESIEEVDAVDSFVMLEGYGERYMGGTHTVTDVLIHPEYQGTNKKYDVAVLKSEDSLVRKGQAVVKLPTMLDVLFTTIGEQFSLLGYGSIIRRAGGGGSRAVREVRARTLPSAQCAGAAATRHLSRGGGQLASGCGPRPLCAGAAGAAAGAAGCAYCAGTPLLRGATLLGSMAAAPCGEACEPALYVNLATVLDWLQSCIKQ